MYVNKAIILLISTIWLMLVIILQLILVFTLEARLVFYFVILNN